VYYDRNGGGRQVVDAVTQEEHKQSRRSELLLFRLENGNFEIFMTKMMVALIAIFLPLSIFLLLLFSSLGGVSYALRSLGRLLGQRLRRKTQHRRQLSISDAKTASASSTVDRSSSSQEQTGEAEVQKEWNGVIGFFHPFW
jgi:hypothetical protein